MKRIVIFLLYISLIINLENVNAKENYYFLALGDSITTGYGVDDSYVEIVNAYLNEKYPDNNIILNNRAINGLTSAQLLNQIKTNIEVKEKIQKANLIVLSIGGNDYLQELIKDISNLDGKNDIFINIGNNLIENTKLIYNNIYNLNNDVIIIVIPLYNPYILLLKENKDLIDIFNETKLEFINEVNIFKNQYNKDIYSLPNLSKKIEVGNNLNPGIDPHPNSNGHKLIGNECINLLDDILINTKEEEKSFFQKYNAYIILVGLIIIAFLLEKSYNKKPRK